MPRGPVVYSLPPGTTPQQPNTPILSSVFNAAMDDIAAAFNTPQPTAYGGTGQTDLVLPDDLFGLKDNVDATKIFKIDASNVPTATTITALAPSIAGTLALTNQVEVGQCRLAISGANLVLSPFNGNGLRIAGAMYVIPTAGVSLAPGVLATATDLNVYAYMNAGVMTLEAVTTAHAVDTTAGNIGVRIKSGDSSRTLVGKVRLGTGPAFVDTANKRFVLNWFNRRNIGTQANFATNRVTSSSSFVEVDAEIRCEFLTWSEEGVSALISGSAANDTAGRGVVTTLGIDGVTPESVQNYAVSPSSNADCPCSVSYNRASMTEGYHYYTVLGKTDGVGTATYRGVSSTFGRTLLSVMTRG